MSSDAKYLGSTQDSLVHEVFVPWSTSLQKSALKQNFVRAGYIFPKMAIPDDVSHSMCSSYNVTVIHPLRCGSLSSNLGGGYDHLDQRSMMEAKLRDSQARSQQGHSFFLALSPLGCSSLDRSQHTVRKPSSCADAMCGGSNQ